MFPVEHEEVTPEYLFGKKVARFRTEDGMSQKKLAEELTRKGMSVDASAVSRLEAGKRALPLAEIYTIAEVLGVSVKSLIPAMPNSKVEFGLVSVAADRAWLGMGANGARLVDATADIVDRLEENHELLSILKDRDGNSPGSPSEYVAWVVQNAERALEGRIDKGDYHIDNLAWVASQELKDSYLDTLREMLAPFIVVGVHPDLREDAAWRQGPPEEANGEHSEAP